MTNTNMTLSMDFGNSKPATSKDWMWSRVPYKGEMGTVVGFDEEAAASGQPSIKVLFSTGRIAILRPLELG